MMIKYFYMANEETTTNEIMDFLKEHMMTRSELKDTFTTKYESTASESRILESVDRFAKLHETLDQVLIPPQLFSSSCWSSEYLVLCI